MTGVNHWGDAITQAGKADLAAAYADAAGRTPDIIYGGGFDLVGLILGPGVYNSPSSLALSGTLTLDGGGDSNAVWIFQVGSTFATAASSSIGLTNGALASHVFWQVGSSATLGTGSDFAGNILADQAITVSTGASVEGRILAQNAAVSLDYNDIALPATPIPEPASAFVKDGASRLILSGNNTNLTGVFWFNAGEIRLGSATGMGNTGNLIFGNNVWLKANNSDDRTITRPIVFAGNVMLGEEETRTGTLTFDGGVDLGGAVRTVTVSNPATKWVEFKGVLANG